jgi:citrate synthase
MPEQSKPDEWRTALTRIAPGKIEIRGVDVTEIMKAGTFADGIYLMLKGERPTPAHSRVMNAILASSIDHGLTPPSSLATRTVMSGGNPLNAAVAGGILTIGESHGGAIEACARILQASVTEGKSAADLVSEMREEKRRMPGFGHRLHDPDPRSVALFEITTEEGVAGPHIALAKDIEAELEKQSGKRLPVNVDGAIAAAISDMGFDWKLGKGFFIISRTPGLVAHAFEEWSREKPMRKMTTFKTVYDGPEGG